MKAARPRAPTLALLLVLALTLEACGRATAELPVVTPTPDSHAGLTILEPLNLSTVHETQVVFRGTAPARSRVVRDASLALDDETISDAAGIWAMVVSLDQGPNELRFRVGDDRSTQVDWIVTFEPSSQPTPSPPDAPASMEPPASPSPTATPSSNATPSPAFGVAPSGPSQEARVVRVVDGDTIHVLISGVDYALRYIGIDTPETVDPNSPVEWMGAEASRANRQLVDGRTVILEEDVSETDRYGRLLRYVWLHEDGEWLLVNRELVGLGYAQVSTYPPDVKYAELFLDAEREARDAGRGLWGEAPASPKPTKKPKSPDGNCDPSYPTVCIPPYPPDLNCGDIPHRRFKVLPPDPHGFDGNDNDGIGCES